MKNTILSFALPLLLLSATPAVATETRILWVDVEGSATVVDGAGNESTAAQFEWSGKEINAFRVSVPDGSAPDGAARLGVVYENALGEMVVGDPDVDTAAVDLDIGSAEWAPFDLADYADRDLLVTLEAGHADWNSGSFERLAVATNSLGNLLDATHVSIQSDLNPPALTPWAPETFTVTVPWAIAYDLAGGTNNAANPEFYTEGQLPIALLPAGREGYTFAGWTNELGAVVEEIAAGSTGDRSFGATWLENVEPPAGASFIYDGTAKTGVPSGTGYSVAGDATATEPGQYTVTLSLETGYIWSDGTATDKTVTWSIAPAVAMTISVPDETTGVVTTNYFATLQEAIDATASSDPVATNVVLRGDVAETVVVTNSVAIDLAGHELDGDVTNAVPAVIGTSVPGGGITGDIVSEGGSARLAIEGGEFDGELSAPDGGSISITGGHFAKDPSDYVADGYYAAGDDTGGYDVLPCRSILDTTITVAAAEYTGVSQVPAVAVETNGVALVPGTDFTVSYATNDLVNADTYAIVVNGIGVWKDSVATNFVITAKSVTITVAGTPSSAVYNGENQTTNVAYVATSESALFDESKVRYSGAATVAGTPVGDYPYGLVNTQFAYDDANIDATFNVTDAAFSITKAEIDVTVVGTASSAVYTGAEQTTNVAYVATSESALFDKSKVQYSGAATVSGTTVGGYPYGLANNQFTYDDANVDATFNVTDAAFTITKAEIAITVAGTASTAVYTGAEQTTNVAWTATSESPLFDAGNVKFNGETTVSGKDVDAYAYGLAVADFTYDDDNVTASFTVTDAAFTITKATIDVAIAGTASTAVYNGETQTTNVAYTATSESPLFDAGNVKFNGETTVSGKDVDAYAYGLAVADFTYDDDNVTASFTVTDAAFTITKAMIDVAIAGTPSTAVYNGETQTTNVAYTATSESPLFDAGNVKFNGETTVSGKDVDAYAYGLAVADFTYDDDNVTASFTVTDTAFTITKATIDVAIAGTASTAVYNGETQTTNVAWTATSESPLFDAGNVVFSGDQMVSGKDVDAYAYGLAVADFTYDDDNVTASFTVTDSAFTITKAEIDVTVTGTASTAVYNGANQTTNVAYVATSESSLFDETKVVYDGEPTVTGKDVKAYAYGLTESQFSYGDENVTARFTVEDSAFTIAKAEIDVMVTGTASTAVYNGANQTTNVAYTATSGSALFDETKVVYDGEPAVTGKDVKAYAYGLAESQFSYGDANVTATFTVTDSAFTITKAAATITVDAASKKHGEDDPEFTGTVTGLVSADDLGTVTYGRTNDVQAIGVYAGVIVAYYTANANYDVTVVPGTFTIEENKLTILWVADGSDFATNILEYGEPLVEPSPAPTKDATAACTYTFAGWVPQPDGTVTSNATYTASFTETTNKYTVAFEWHGGSSSADYDYGTLAADVAVPPDPATYVEKGTIYTFTGWSPAPVADVTGAATYTAQYADAAAVATVITIADATTGATTTNYYGSLTAALEAAPTNSTVQLLADVEEPAVALDTPITLDLNGNDWTVTAAEGETTTNSIAVSVPVSVVDSSEDGGGTIRSYADSVVSIAGASAESPASLTVGEGASIDATGGTLVTTIDAVRIGDNASLVVDGGSIGGGNISVAENATGVSVAVAGGTVFGVIDVREGATATVDVTGGFVQGVVAQRSAAAIDVSGGTVSSIEVGDQSTVAISGSDTAIDNLYGYGAITVEGGTVHSINADGPLAITGGAIVAPAQGLDAIVVSGGTATISGGSVYGGLETTFGGTMSITGGFFTEDPSDYVAQGYYAATVTGGYEVLPQKSILGTTITVADGSVYDGTGKEPMVTVATNGVAIAATDGYTLSWANNTNAGENASVTITGTGAWKDSATVTFAIAKKALGLAWSNTSLVYTGEPQAPTAEATGIVAGDNVSVFVSGAQTQPGTYTATASLSGAEAGNYALPDPATTEFTITAVYIAQVGETKYFAIADAIAAAGGLVAEPEVITLLTNADASVMLTAPAQRLRVALDGHELTVLSGDPVRYEVAQTADASEAGVTVYALEQLKADGLMIVRFDYEAAKLAYDMGTAENMLRMYPTNQPIWCTIATATDLAAPLWTTVESSRAWKENLVPLADATDDDLEWLENLDTTSSPVRFWRIAVTPFALKPNEEVGFKPAKPAGE